MRKRSFWHVRPTKTRISLCIREVWLESSLFAWLCTLKCTQWRFHQNARMLRQIRWSHMPEDSFSDVVAHFVLIHNTVDSLSRTRLSRITAYLEVKILSLPKHENLTTSKKYCRKEEKLLLRSNFSSFPQYFRYTCISNVKSPNTYKFFKCGCSNYFFLSSENLICRGTDISKCFRESLGIRNNESRLYVSYFITLLLYLNYTFLLSDVRSGST